jgi:hypothetical protein
MAKAKHKSARADGRGGWPKGKRRNPDTGDWARVRIELQALLDDAWQFGVVSGSQLAATLGYSERSVRRWLKGEDRPPPAVQEMIRAWIAEKRPAVKGR